MGVRTTVTAKFIVKSAAAGCVFTDRIVSVVTVGLILIALTGRVVVKVSVFTVQVVLVNPVRLLTTVLPGKLVVIVNVPAVQVVSATTVRLILIAFAGKIVVTANAKTVAWGLLVPVTLTVELDEIVAKEFASPSTKIAICIIMLPA